MKPRGTDSGTADNSRFIHTTESFHPVTVFSHCHFIHCYAKYNYGLSNLKIDNQKTNKKKTEWPSVEYIAPPRLNNPTHVFLALIIGLTMLRKVMKRVPGSNPLTGSEPKSNWLMFLGRQSVQ